MRTGIFNSVLCLIGIHSPALCMAQLNWKNQKNVHHKETQERGLRIATTQDLVYFSQQLSNEKNFREHLNRILIPRPVGSQGHRDVRQYITSTMRGLGWDVDTPTFTDKTPIGNKQFTNIIATLDTNAPRRLVVACHYDTLIKPEGFLGATDSAVPCAMMLNMAATLKRNLAELKSQNPDLTLQFIFFDGEEAFVRWTSTDSIYGSRNLAKTWENQDYQHKGVTGNHNDRIDIFVLLDLIGARGMQFSKLERSTGDWYDRLVAIERNLRGTNVISGNTLFKDEFLPAGIEDDHIPFKRRGVPILHLIAYPFPRAWHKMGDNLDSLDFNQIADFNAILRVFLAEYLHLP